MTDVEIVVRFFAFRDKDTISGSVRGMLDDVTSKNRFATEKELTELRKEFEDALDLCVSVFGDQVFRLPPQEEGTKAKLSRPLFDAEMVAMHLHRDRKEEITERSDAIKEEVLRLARPHAATYDLIVGRANTSASIKERIEAVSATILRVLDGTA